jgi:hypothetical protein
LHFIGIIKLNYNQNFSSVVSKDLECKMNQMPASNSASPLPLTGKAAASFDAFHDIDPSIFDFFQDGKANPSQFATGF